MHNNNRYPLKSSSVKLFFKKQKITILTSLPYKFIVDISWTFTLFSMHQFLINRYGQLFSFAGERLLAEAGDRSRAGWR